MKLKTSLAHALVILLALAACQAERERVTFSDSSSLRFDETPAGPYEDGVEALQRGEPQIAYELFRPLAERGDARAQYQLGVMYQYGMGGLQLDWETARQWYKRAAEQDYADAQYKLSGLLEGQESLYWLCRAADNGNRDAQLELRMSAELVLNAFRRAGGPLPSVEEIIEESCAR
jgi:TPR repeat protein